MFFGLLHLRSFGRAPERVHSELLLMSTLVPDTAPRTLFPKYQTSNQFTKQNVYLFYLVLSSKGPLFYVHGEICLPLCTEQFQQVPTCSFYLTFVWT